MATAVLRVAVVDDEAPVRTALARLLRLADYDVDMFASGEEFLAAIDARHPDCVVLDINMPGPSGFEVQSRLKSAHVNIPVVFIAASARSGRHAALEKAVLRGRIARRNRRGALQAAGRRLMKWNR
jgi:FixJ family two-component response regulator